MSLGGSSSRSNSSGNSQSQQTAQNSSVQNSSQASSNVSNSTSVAASNSSSQNTAQNSAQSVNQGSSQNASLSNSASRSSTADELTGFFNAFNEATGGMANNQAAQAPINYQGSSVGDVQALGGLGATRENKIRQAFDEASMVINEDPTLTPAQRQRSLQLVNQDYRSEIDAVASETDASITNFIQGENMTMFDSLMRGRDSDQATARLLQDIFFGGKGNQSTSTAASAGQSSNTGSSASQGTSQGTGSSTSNSNTVSTSTGTSSGGSSGSSQGNSQGTSAANNSSRSRSISLSGGL